MVKFAYRIHSWANMPHYLSLIQIQVRRSMNKTILCTLAASLPAISAVASEVTLADTLYNVVVSAPYKTAVELTPLTVTTVTATTIEKSTESSLLPVLQNQVPGLFVS